MKQESFMFVIPNDIVVCCHTSCFVFQSLKDIDYVIKDRTFLESIMDTEFDETMETGVFYNGMTGYEIRNIYY